MSSQDVDGGMNLARFQGTGVPRGEEKALPSSIPVSHDTEAKLGLD